MTIALLIFVALVLPMALLYLTVSLNEFEKSTRTLGEFIKKRYIFEPPKKAAESKAMQSIMKPLAKP
jgi:hypothetical protein